MRKRSVQGLLTLFLALAGCHVYVGGWPVNFGAPVRARVVDVETGHPLGGVVVLGHWYSEEQLIHEGSRLRHAAASTTDPTGVFQLSGMPLKIRFPFHAYGGYDPVLWLYKPGYKVHRFTNFATGEHDFATRRRSMAMRRLSVWDGKTLGLKREQSVEGEAASLRVLASEVNRTAASYTRPDRTPSVWNVMSEGYLRLPEHLKETTGDPRHLVDYWTKAQKGAP